MQEKHREEKHKVTLYLPHELHRQLKIRAAVDSETMTDIAQRAIVFYLSHPEVVEQLSLHGQAHRVYSCPECHTHVVLRDGEMTSIGDQSNVLIEESLAVEKVSRVGSVNADSQGEGELVPC
ncbi:hypothetical protein ACN4EK_17020 [Pantanalinema rosaneae CENA516]|uniref:hypothetical protein n=1 Tax=Pantanalinema rosaneae TaxID=1620701 RepID=UPI003D6F66D4